MNIFALDPSPRISASYHCDQHLHKMILESAQMLSTAMHKWYPHLAPHIYKPAYEKHPCTIWVGESKNNAVWVAKLMYYLNDIRVSLGSESHSSMEIYKIFYDNLDIYPGILHLEFVFAGPAHLKLNNSLSIHQKYQEFYKLKYHQWLDTSHKMSYTGRTIPYFMQETFESN